MATIRGVVKEVNVEDFYIIVETIRGEEIKIFVDTVDYNPGDTIMANGTIKNGIMYDTKIIIKLPSKEIAELDEKYNEKIWKTYGVLINKYKEEREKELDELFKKLDDEKEEGGDE